MDLALELCAWETTNNITVNYKTSTKNITLFLWRLFLNFSSDIREDRLDIYELDSYNHRGLTHTSLSQF